MEEKTTCPLCKDLSNKCFVERTEIEGEPFESYLCFQCGMTSNSYMAIDSEKLEDMVKGNTQLMNEAKIIDEERDIIWFPSVINMGEKGMIYPDGTTSNWHWYYARVVDVTEEEREKYDGMEKRLDIETPQKFGQFEFTEACMAMGIIKDETTG
tara:strand:- start:494 stop:955 length:462 start_codon:yes stop_codon:yes gene_type:complete